MLQRVNLLIKLEAACSVTSTFLKRFQKSKAFMLPSNVSFDGSTCGKESKEPQLAIGFGRGHFWTINFIRTADTYQGNISFTYNTNDTQLFPDAKRKGRSENVLCL